MKKFKIARTISQSTFPVGRWGAKLSFSKAFNMLKFLKTFICNSFKGELSKVNSEQSRQSRVNREQNGINANNCRTVNSRQFTHNAILSTIHSLAFTLAETLIVMGIIGVVAALTIPNMNYLDASHTSDEDAGVCKNGHQLTIEEPSCK